MDPSRGRQLTLKDTFMGEKITPKKAKALQKEKKTTKLQIIYEPRGRAKEYAGLACNLYVGCDHECGYCWGPDFLHMKREDFMHPHVRTDVLRKIREDVTILQNHGDKRHILIQFIGDPYCHLNDQIGITRKALEIIFEAELSVEILTKGGKRSEQDFDLIKQYPHQCTYATTLTLLDEGMRKEWEPRAAPTMERIQALIHAKEFGIPTWVSLEPVIEPEQTLKLIQRIAGNVDEIRVGKMNYHEIARQIDWKRFGEQAVELLEELGCKYLLKRDLKIAMGIGDE